VHHGRGLRATWLSGRPGPAAGPDEVVDRRLLDALTRANRSALGMPGSVDTFKQWLADAKLALVPVERAHG